MKRIILSFVLMLGAVCLIKAQDEEQENTGEKKVTGWTFGAVPALAYDADVGFLYGGIVNLYEFGDGSSYPEYHHSIYLEWSRTTKGKGINQITYDSKYLIPGIRVSANVSYFTEKALDFYGFNGYESLYNPGFELEDDPAYLSRVWYRMDRKQFLGQIELMGGITDKLKWYGSYAYNNFSLDTVDIDRLNEGRDVDELLPEIGGLYGKYLEWGIIPEEHQNGGQVHLLKGGLVWDSRDNEPNPMNGIWTEMIFMAGLTSHGGDLNFTRLALTHRQYFTLAPKVLNFAYRISYQTRLTGEMPFYYLPFVHNTPPNYTRDGLGGAKTIRGVLRNRVVGEDFVYGNLELRWKFLRTLLLKQNFYIALSAFLDGGMVTGKYDFEVPDGITDPLFNQYHWFNAGDESLHLGTGAGLHFALNENFIVAVDYGFALKEEDGNSGLYINLNFLF